MGYSTEGDKRIGALREKGNKYAFKEWEYDATTGKPTKAVYQNTKTGNLKRISRLADDVIACNKCGDKLKKQKNAQDALVYTTVQLNAKGQAGAHTSLHVCPK